MGRTEGRTRSSLAALPKLKKLELFANKLSQTAKDAWEAVEAKRSGLRVIL